MHIDVNVGDGGGAEAAGTTAATRGEQGRVEGVKPNRAQLLQLHSAEMRNEMAIRQVFVELGRGGLDGATGDGGLQVREPGVLNEGLDGDAGRWCPRPALHFGEDAIQMCLCQLLGPEPTLCLLY